MSIQTLTFKIESLYCAYAPDAGVHCYGGCFEEAVNTLADELRSIGAGTGKGVARKGARDVLI